jgi:hypothetical protein
MQRARGNAYVARALGPEIDRQAEQGSTPAPTGSSAEAGPTEIASGGNVVRVTPGGVEVSGGVVRVNAALSSFSGVLQADTLIANSVVSSSYTPGAGNIQ